MSAFIAYAALFVIAALFFVLPPLLRARNAATGVSREAVNVSVYRDQLRELDADLAAGLLTRDRHEEAKREVERRLLEDAAPSSSQHASVPGTRRAAWVVGVAVPVLAGVLYFLTGTPAALDPERIAASEQGHTMDRQQMEALVVQLAQKLRDSSDPNPEGWAMLGRSYNSMGRYQEAVDAFRTALKRGPPDARLLADYADALAMAQGRTLAGEPEKLIAQALELDPQNIKALALAGTVAFDKKNYRQAVAHWEKIVALSPPDSELVRSVQGSIEEARSLGGIKGPVAAAPVQAAPQGQSDDGAAGATGGHVGGEVRLAPTLAAKLSPQDTLFIYARAPNGPRMPLAILRKAASDLPAKFVLDDAMAMTPQNRISAYPEVVVEARVSKSGSAMPQSGDLEGSSKPVKVGAADMVVVIDRVVK